MLSFENSWPYGLAQGKVKCMLSSGIPGQRHINETSKFSCLVSLMVKPF